MVSGDYTVAVLIMLLYDFHIHKPWFLGTQHTSRKTWFYMFKNTVLP